MKKLTNLLVLLLFAGLQVAYTQRPITGTITKANEGTNLFGQNDSIADSAKRVSEFVVTALGIKRESRSLGYGITIVKEDIILTSKSTNMMESLAGKVSGLNITIPSAGVGGSSQIRLRGQAGFVGVNNAPLIIINGLPMDQDARGANGNNMRDLGDNLNSINPEDIESMTVLRGATAAAIYGSRAANGAIIITTKSGQRNQGVGVEYSGSFTSQQPLNFMDNLQYVYGQGMFGAKPISTLNAAGTGQFGWGARMDGELVPIFDGSMQPYSPNKDNLFKYYRSGVVWANTLAFSGGTDKGSFRASFSRRDANGIDPYNEYKKNIANIGVNYNITHRVVFTMNVNYSNEKYINPPELGQQGPGAMNFFPRLSSSIPFEALKNSATNPDTGTEAQTSGFQGTILNPMYAYGDAGQRFENTRNRFLGTAALRYDITDWLYAQGRLNYNHSPYSTESKVPGGIGTSQPINTADGTYKGSYSVIEGEESEINADFLAGVRKRFDKFTMDASFGGNTYRLKNQSSGKTYSNFIVRDVFTIANANNQTEDYYEYFKTQVNSLYGLVEFGFNSTFYLNFTGRKDWFSVFPTNNSRFYPAVTGSFVFSELLKNLVWLDYAKLRGGWAKVGTTPGPKIIIGSDFDAGTTIEKEIGLEARLFNKKLCIDVAAFDKVSTDQELIVIFSGIPGLPNTIKNVGSLKNSGIEFMIEYTPIQTSDFRWTTSWNNSFLKTEVLSVGENADGSKIKDLLVIDFNSTGNEFLGELHYTVGMPMNQLYTRSYLRNENGDIVVRDNGRLLATPDYIPVGSSIPKLIGGWDNTFKYKNLALSIFIDYKLGGTVLSATNLNLTRQGFSKLSLEGRREGESGMIFPGVYDANPDPDINDWQPNTTAVTDLQTFYGDYRNLQIGDPFTFKSDFVKLRNISISYDITGGVNKVKFLGFVKGLMLTASCRNVAILYKDIINLDPEAIQSSGDFRAGYENAALPTTRNFMFTINARF